MPPPRKTTTTELNQTVFECFSPSMSDEEEPSASWEETGAFPTGSPSTSKSHIFTDEPYDNQYYPSALDVVDEGSGETRDSLSRSEIVATGSTASTVTPAIDNTADAAMRKIKAQHQRQQQKIGSKEGSGSGAGLYPFKLYQNLAGIDAKRNPEQEQDSKDLEKPKNRSFTTASSRGTTATATTSSRKVDVESGSMPSPMTPISVGEESSVVSDQQSHVMDVTSQAPYSVVSGRSRRQSKRYMVRHTMSTSQQVNAHPATMLKNLFIAIEQERHMHKLAAQNLKAVHNWIFFLPAIVLTLLSGLVILVFEADINAASEDARVYAAIAAGVAALTSVFWQALSKMLDLGTRGTLHDTTSGVLKRLSEDILLTLSSTEAIPADYVAMVGEKFAQALDASPATIPYKLEAAFSAVSDRMVLMLKPPMGQPPRKYVHKLDFMRLYATVYDEMNTEIIHFWAWPLAFPQPRSASEGALRNFKAIITEGREASKEEKGCLRFFCPFGSPPRNERSLFDVVPTASIADTSGAGTQSQYNIRNAMLGQEI